MQADLERFEPKWIPARVKKTRQNKQPEPRSDFIGREKALARDLLLRRNAIDGADFGAG